MLSRLLNSSHPEDLKAANKLIKEMVQEVKLPLHCRTIILTAELPVHQPNGFGCSQDQKRTEKVTKRVNAIQEVKESVALLSQLLQDYDSTATRQSNAELVQVKRKELARNGPNGEAIAPFSCVCVCPQDLYQRCEKMRPTLFRLASDTEDNDEALGEHSVQHLGCSTAPAVLKTRRTEGGGKKTSPLVLFQRRFCRPTTA